MINRELSNLNTSTNEKKVEVDNKIENIESIFIGKI